MVKELFVDDQATAGEAIAVEEAFARAGFPVTVERGLIPSPSDAERWKVVCTIDVPIPAFFAAFTDEGGRETASAVKVWAHEIFEARWVPGGRPRGEIMLHGRRGTDVMLSSDMPTTAFESLLDLEWGPAAESTPEGLDNPAADFLWHMHNADYARYFKWDAAQNEWFDQYQRLPSPSRWARWKWFLLPLIGLLVAALARLRRR
jgi:hypothetical protein